MLQTLSRPGETVKRKLSTIFCADVHNYGRMMARDEGGTLERLNRYRGIMDRQFERHDGRKVNTWGDAVIAEFTSVVEAVRCAVEIQDAIGAENRDQPDDRRMWFRIGINLGDVMDDEGDIYGDGVNLASRLESLAEPGGIMVSPSVYEFSHKQLALGFDFAGTHQIKDGENPVAAYRVRTGGANAPGGSKTRVKSPRPAIAGRPFARSRVSQLFRRLEVRAERFMAWFSGQPRSVQGAAVMIGFFFSINALFSGIATPWFIFPSLPFALYILWRMRRIKDI